MIEYYIDDRTFRYRQRNRMKVSRFVFLLLLYMFIFNDLLQVYIPSFGYLDEIIALFSVPFFLFDIKKFGLKYKKGNYTVYIVLLVIVGFLGNILYHFQNVSAAVLDAFLCIKFWLVLYVGRKLFANFSIKENANVLYRHIKMITILFVIMTIAAELNYSPFIGDTRYGLRTVRLFYYHPSTYAAMCCLLISILVSIEPYVRHSKVFGVILLFLMCTTLRSKAIGAVISIVLIYYFVVIRKRKFRIRTLLLFIPLLVAIAWDNIYFYFFSSIQSTSARYRLLTTSFMIAKDYFPIGGGFGTFGSFTSGEYYSPLYSIYGIQYVFGLERGNAWFISDSFWPMIVGQFGVLGLCLLIAALVRLFLKIQTIRTNNEYYYMSALIVLVYLLISSVAEAAFVHPIAIPMGMWLGCIFLNHQKFLER